MPTEDELTLRAELEEAYARLRAIPVEDRTGDELAKIELLERELLKQYDTNVMKRRASSRPPPK